MNDVNQWVTSNEPTHEALVTSELFAAAQAMFDTSKRTSTRQPARGHLYALAGRMRCGVCGRRMQAQWNHGRAYYRCKFPDEYPNAEADHPRNL
jgi:site-specific DNA recombinase